jgi:hypothetical protein
VDGDYRNNLTSSSAQQRLTLSHMRPKLHFTNETTGFKLFCDGADPQAGDTGGTWKIAQAKNTDRVSFASTVSDTDVETPTFEASNAQDKTWTDSGPPKNCDNTYRYTGTTGGWHRSDMDPSEVHPSLSVEGFATVKYEAVFPRRIDLTFQTWLGATVRGASGCDQLEFQIMLIEQSLYMFLQLAAIAFVLQVYLVNVDMTSEQHSSLSWALIPAANQWIRTQVFGPSCVSYDYLVMENVTMCSATDITTHTGQELCGQKGCKYKPEDTMKLADSEILLPLIMYIFVCFITATEIAMFSGMDTLSSSREDRWYRRAIKSWDDARLEQRDTHTGEGGERHGHRKEKAKGCASTFWQMLCGGLDMFHVGLILVLLGVVLVPVGIFVIKSRPVPTGEIEDKSKMIVAGVAAFIVGFIICSLRAGMIRSCLDSLYLVMLSIVLGFMGLLSRSQTIMSMKSFNEELKKTDRKIQTSLRLDERDDIRRFELSQTYIEGASWKKHVKDGPNGFERHFQSVDDAVITSDIERLRQEMRVFQMRKPGKKVSSQTPEMMHTETPEEKRFKEATHIFEDKEQPGVGNDSTCTNAGSIAFMIEFLAKARRLVHTSRNILIVSVVSFLHATVPVWHAWLPTWLGGGCGVWTADGTEAADPWLWDLWADVQWQAGPWLACSENHQQLWVHTLCVFLNYTLTYGVLGRLLKCQADYFARYCHMLYFIQLTPWSNLRYSKLKEHWGLLPTFDLNTPGNIEAWNKLRLYLQSTSIKTSRYLQASVLWCFFGVVAMSVIKIIEMVVVQSEKTQEALLCTQFFDDSAPAHHQCNQINGCMWINQTQSHVALPSDAQECAVNRCVPVTCTALKSPDECNQNDKYCDWDSVKNCEKIEQHFDTMSTFVVLETLIIGAQQQQLPVTCWP